MFSEKITKYFKKLFSITNLKLLHWKFIITNAFIYACCQGDSLSE